MEAPIAIAIAIAGIITTKESTIPDPSYDVNSIPTMDRFVICRLWPLPAAGDLSIRHANMHKQSSLPR